MARYKLVDRAHVLDAAEQVIRSKGLGGLSIDAIAKAAGISKGGVQSSFGTKEQLIHAMLERLVAEFDAQVAQLAGDSPTPRQRLKAYVEATCRLKKADADRAAGMLAALLNAPDQLREWQAWYENKLAEFDVTTPEGRQARMVFLACEGAFMLRSFGFMKITQSEWQHIFLDLHEQLDSSNQPNER